MALEHGFKNFDEVLEYAASLIEETDFSDLRGVWAKKKRDREDAALRLRTSEEVRQRCAGHIRAMKQRPDLTPLGKLKEIAESTSHFPHLIDAWPLAWRGWVDIECTIKCNGNSHPPETNYRIVLTEMGRAALAASSVPQSPISEHQSDDATAQAAVVP